MKGILKLISVMIFGVVICVVKCDCMEDPQDEFGISINLPTVDGGSVNSVMVDTNGDGVFDGLDIDDDGLSDLFFLDDPSDMLAGVDVDEDKQVDFYYKVVKNGKNNEVIFVTDKKMTVNNVYFTKDAAGNVNGVDLNGDGIADKEILQSTTKFTKFQFEASRNPALTTDAVATVSRTTVTAALPVTKSIGESIAVTSMIASWTTTGDVVSVNGVTQVNGQTANNYSAGIVFKIKSQNGSERETIVTISHDGKAQLDSTFGTGGKVIMKDYSSSYGASVVNSIAIDSSYNIFAAGNAVNNSYSTTHLNLWRLNSDTTVHSAFGSSGVVIFYGSSPQINYAYGNNIAISSTGKLYVAANGNPTGSNSFITMCYNYNGTTSDSQTGETFNGSNGYVSESLGYSNNSSQSIQVDSDGKIFSTGFLDTMDTDIKIIKYKTDGTKDTGYGTSGILTFSNIGKLGANERAYASIIDSAGKLTATGYTENASGNKDMTIVRGTVSGGQDTSIGTNGAVTHNSAAGGNGDDIGYAIAIDSTGRILVAGSSKNASNNLDMAVWRYNNNGSIDTTFGTGGVVVHNNAAGGNGDDEAFGIVLLSNGKIAVAGYSKNAVNKDIALIFLNDNGSICTDFSPTGTLVYNGLAGGSGDDEAKCIIVDSSKRLLIGGYSTDAGGVKKGIVMRVK